MMQLAPITQTEQNAEQKVERGGQKTLRSMPQAVGLSPAALSAESFSSYPPEARAVATQYIALLRTLPLPLLPLLLHEIESYDFRFPRERQTVLAQLQQLQAMPGSQLETLTAPFRALQLPASLLNVNWLADPGKFLNALTSTLWSTGQMPQFRKAAEQYAAALPPPPSADSALPRQVFVILDQDLAGTPTFAKLRTHGVQLQIVDPDGLPLLLQHLHERSAAEPAPYAHWYIDGGALAAAPASAAGAPSVAQVSYDALAPVRARLLQRAQNTMSAERSGPEELRSLMAGLTPEQTGMNPAEPVLSHFQLSLLTEGSGTQIFATTFVQWAARECLRRAEPTTLLLRFTPRQLQQGMNAMLSGEPSAGPDLPGSLIDAEQGAYYTWLNLQRLSGADRSTFLVWHQGLHAAVAIGPGLPRGTRSTAPQTMQQALRLLA